MPRSAWRTGKPSSSVASNSTTQNNVVDKVPFFGDLPYVGRLFRRDALQEKKSELLVFLTPRIMSDQAIAVSR